MNNKLVGVGLGIVLVVWMVMRDQKQKSGTSEAVRDEARMIISQMEGYENDKTYMESVVTRAHDQAFSVAYKDARHGGGFGHPSPQASMRTTISAHCFCTHAGSFKMISTDFQKETR